MQDDENVKFILKKTRHCEVFANMSEEDIKTIINFLCELARIENKIINYKKVSA